MMTDRTIRVGGKPIFEIKESYCLREMLPPGELVEEECERVLECAKEAVENLGRLRLPDPIVKDRGCEQQALAVADSADRILAAEPPPVPRTMDAEVSRDLFLLIQAQFLALARAPGWRLDLSRLGFTSKRRADKANFQGRQWFSFVTAHLYGLVEGKKLGLCKFDEQRAVELLLQSNRRFAIGAEQAPVRFFLAPKFEEIERPKGTIIKILIQGELPTNDVPGALRGATTEEARSLREGKSDEEARELALRRWGCVILHCVAAFGETVSTAPP